MRHMFVVSCLMVLAVAAASSSWMDTGLSPSERAKLLVNNMTLDEKLNYLHGSCSGYVGNVCANDRLGIPAIKMNDGPQGFRDNAHPGTTTAFPSGMTVGASFDQYTAHAFGDTMGQEFFAKGSNVQLGPGVCVARVPRNGRNFEYISGEDPFLGWKMVQPVIKGIQGQGVVANAKHWVNNNQETNRGTVSENVDERTQFEIYYPPFEGAVEAGVGSVMCSYNKIRGTWSCENPQTLQRDLKDRLGFEGWVMSDWGATHSTSINAGLDQEMPGGRHMGSDALKALLSSGDVKQSKVDDSVLRILTPLIAVGVLDVPNNGSTSDDVTSEEHNAIVRSMAANSTVLLKNKDALLPLDPSKLSKVAVIGQQAMTPIVHGGGSGQVVPKYTSSPLVALRSAFGFPSPKPIDNNCSQGHFEEGIDYYNQDEQTSQRADDVSACCLACSNRVGCLYFSFQKSSKICYMKASNSGRRSNSDVTSGGCYAQPPVTTDCYGGKCVYFNDGSDVDAAASEAAEAEVAIVFVATSSSEGGDRGSLSLGNGQDELIAAVAKANPKTIVVAVTPGAILTPWAGNVSGILVPFMPGQEYGNAITDVMTGKTNPSARLPLTFPNTENEVGFTTNEWPGINLQANYTEALLVGYRWYDHHQVKPAFPFGHGLSYTSFGYSELTASASPTSLANDVQQVTVKITNTGSVAGSEIVQLYLGFPASAGEPPKQLKGFEKVFLQPGVKSEVTFKLNSRSCSVWDAVQHKWSQISGTFKVYVGASSRDIRATTEFTL